MLYSLEIKNEPELYNVKTVQLLKYQINNPLIKSSTYKEMKIKPYVFLLELLTRLDDQSIDMIEYKLFVCRAHHYDEIEKVFEQIKSWRSLNEDEKNIFLRLFRVQHGKMYLHGLHVPIRHHPR